VSTYQPNELNQYAQRTVAGAIDVFGLADPQAAVQVNGVTASRYEAYFHRAVSVDNSASAQYPEITIQADNNSAARHAFVPKNPEVFEYDDDGNLTEDGRWVYEWNGENRLIRMTTRSDVPGPHYQLTFQYDWMGRRIRKTVVDTDTGQTSSDLIFLYDGWNLIAEVNAQTGELIRTYVWGLDLSGTFQGAGGIGGLLWVNVETGGHAGRYFAAYDGNGNVMGLVSASDGSVVAQYEYGPFAEPLRATGPLAADNPFRFSTKYTDSETGLVYYGYRYSDPPTGRWLSRDPIGELGFLLTFESTRPRALSELLYAFATNDPINQWDYLGLSVDSPTASFLAALAQRQWGQAWIILEVTASTAGRAVWEAAYTRAVAASVALDMGPALSQANRAWHIVQPKHQWCRLVQLVNNVAANAVANFQRVQGIIAKAWNEGSILAVLRDGRVVKEAVIQGRRVVVQGRVLLNGSGTVEIVDAWVTR